MNNETFCRKQIRSAQSIIGTEENPDAAILLFFDDDDYCKGYGQFEEALKALTKHDILKPYKTDQSFRSSNVTVDDVSYNLYVFDK